jgi:hypothetical protein
LFGDVQSLRDGRYPQAPDLHKRLANLGRLHIPWSWPLEHGTSEDTVVFQLIKAVSQFGVCDHHLLYPLWWVLLWPSRVHSSVPSKSTFLVSMCTLSLLYFVQGDRKVMQSILNIYWWLQFGTIQLD